MKPSTVHQIHERILHLIFPLSSISSKQTSNLHFGPNYVLRTQQRQLFYQIESEPFLRRTRKLPCIFAALFVCYSSRLRLRDSLLRPCYDFLLFFTTQTRPVHRETDSGDEKFITPINKIHNPILGYVPDFHSTFVKNPTLKSSFLDFKLDLKFLVFRMAPESMFNIGFLWLALLKKSRPMLQKNTIFKALLSN